MWSLPIWFIYNKSNQPGNSMLRFPLKTKPIVLIFNNEICIRNGMKSTQLYYWHEHSPYDVSPLSVSNSNKKKQQQNICCFQSTFNIGMKLNKNMSVQAYLCLPFSLDWNGDTYSRTIKKSSPMRKITHKTSRLTNKLVFTFEWAGQ